MRDNIDLPVVTCSGWLVILFLGSVFVGFEIILINRIIDGGIIVSDVFLMVVAVYGGGGILFGTLITNDTKITICEEGVRRDVDIVLFGFDLYHRNTLIEWENICTVSIWRLEYTPFKGGFAITPKGRNLSRRDTITITWFTTDYKRAMVALCENLGPTKIEEEAMQRIKQYRSNTRAA
jgi:hypothetical protein